MTTLALVFLRIGLAALLAVAGLTKLADREGAARAAREFGLGRFASVTALTVPPVELALAVMLVPATTARFAAGGAALLLAAFATVIAVALARGRRPDCHCFGKLHSSAAGPGTLVRNAGLAVLAALIAARPAPAAGWLELGSSGVVILVAAQALLAFTLLRRYGRALRRIEELETGVERPAVLAVGDEAPDFTLPRLAGGEVALRELLDPARSLLLVFVDPGCGPCHELVPKVAGWLDDRVTPVFISRGELDANAVFAEFGEVLLQREREVADLYAAYGTPSAILISPDGRIQQRLASGRAAIEELVAAELAARAAARATRVVAAAAVAAGVAAVAAPNAAARDNTSTDPQLQEVDSILKAAVPQLTATAKAARKALQAQATLKTGKAQRARQAAARKALEAERQAVLAVRASLKNLTFDGTTSRDAYNARELAAYSARMFADSLEKLKESVGARPKVALALVSESRTLLRRSVDASAQVAKLLGWVP